MPEEKGQAEKKMAGAVDPNNNVMSDVFQSAHKAASSQAEEVNHCQIIMVLTGTC